MTKLEELIKVLTKKHVYIQPHNYPDQDAIASAFGLQELLRQKGIEATICYKGFVDKANTQKMISSLEIEMIPAEQALFQDEDEIILVDGQKGNTNMWDLPGREVACIDHHKLNVHGEYLFSDIRSNVGACASIIASYFVENNIEIPTRVVTALTYGIRVDTYTLARGVSELDIDMFSMLYKIADLNDLSKMYFADITVRDLASYGRAISSLNIQGRLGVSEVEPDCSEALIGSISDFLLSLAEIEISLVASYRGGGVKFSIRSENEGVDVADIISKALEGLGNGGGHATMAAGFVPGVGGEEEAVRVMRMVEKRVQELAYPNPGTASEQEGI